MAKRLFSFFLLSIFLGFYAGITLFSHSHIINGVTIVHSHFYKPGTDGKPVPHQHSEKEYSLIQFLSGFTFTFTGCLTAVGIILSLIYRIVSLSDGHHYLTPRGNCTYSLRAPPLAN